MAALTVQNALEGDGLDLTLNSAAGGGDTFTYSKSTVLHVTNDDGSPVTVTITVITSSLKTPGIGTTTKASVAHQVAANTTAIIDPRSSAFRNTSGLVAVTYSGVTSLFVTPIKFDQL